MSAELFCIVLKMTLIEIENALFVSKPIKFVLINFYERRWRRAISLLMFPKFNPHSPREYTRKASNVCTLASNHWNQ